MEESANNAGSAGSAPKWGPLPNYDVEDPNDLNTSFVLIVQNATEREVREEVAYFEPDARGYFRL
ncbi:hypothetical protein ACFPIJ_21860 [Dactylosporangium cerinum]|uniref:Uncharacterized protein n=1 Tax=Dactylosporangium cerinum TaxID=1434730 RepID=A0ABV9VWM0_9ACTN